MIRNNLPILLIAMLIFLVACQTVNPQPTPVPTAVPNTPLPPTEQLLPTVTSTATSLSTQTSTESLFKQASPDPIIHPGDGGSQFQALQNPGAVIFHEGKFHMFRNGYPALPSRAVIGYSTSPDGIHWNYDAAEPVFSTDDVPYADIMIFASSVIVQDDGTWVLYFLIWDTSNIPGAIGRATAPSPTGLWTADPEPVFLPGEPGSWDASQVTQPSLLPNEAGDGYLMYYTGVDANGVERIGLATSSDGITWARYNDPATTELLYAQSDPVLEPGTEDEWDVRGAARGRVVRAPEGYAMMYRTPISGSGFTYGLAVSMDGIHWTKYANNPILERTDISRATGLFFPTFAYHDGVYYFFIEVYNGKSRIHLLTRDEPLDIIGMINRASPTAVTDLQAVDVRNENNASDIQVRFGPAAASAVTGYRLFVVKAKAASNFNLETADSLTVDRVLDIPAITQPFQAELPAGLLDSDGETITEGTPYDIFVLSQAEGIRTLIHLPEPLVLANETAVRTLIADLPASTGGVAVNSQGIVHVANIGAIPNRIGKDIYQITPDGQATLWVSGQGLLGASGNTFDADGNLIQSSLTGNVIHRITPDGTITELVREGIHGPVGVVLATDGTLFVANCSGISIQRVLPDGTSTPLAKDSQLFRCPNGITLDESGNVYVSNFRNGMIFKVTTNGKITPLAELPGGNNAHLTYMNGLLYVVDRGNHQIYTVTLDGETTLFAGTGERGHQDGPALQATFSLPNDIVFSTDGHHLYLNEVSPTKGSNNNPSAVRVIELPREE
jgi:predicted GH43/DUF377 family glycosyl hydrolase